MADEKIEDKEEIRASMNGKKHSISGERPSSSCYSSSTEKMELDAARTLADLAQLALLQSKNGETRGKWGIKGRKSRKRVQDEYLVSEWCEKSLESCKIRRTKAKFKSSDLVQLVAAPHEEISEHEENIDEEIIILDSEFQGDDKGRDAPKGAPLVENTNRSSPVVNMVFLSQSTPQRPVIPERDHEKNDAEDDQGEKTTKVIEKMIVRVDKSRNMEPASIQSEGIQLKLIEEPKEDLPKALTSGYTMVLSPSQYIYLKKQEAEAEADNESIIPYLHFLKTCPNDDAFFKQLKWAASGFIDLVEAGLLDDETTLNLGKRRAKTPGNPQVLFHESKKVLLKFPLFFTVFPQEFRLPKSLHGQKEIVKKSLVHNGMEKFVKIHMKLYKGHKLPHLKIQSMKSKLSEVRDFGLHCDIAAILISFLDKSSMKDNIGKNASRIVISC